MAFQNERYMLAYAVGSSVIMERLGEEGVRRFFSITYSCPGRISLG
jgi:hypothetical protein